MGKLNQNTLPDCWILDRGTLKWARKTYTIVAVMDLRSRKVLSWSLLRPLQSAAVAQVLTDALRIYGQPPALVVGIDKVFQSQALQAVYATHGLSLIDLRQGKVSVTIFIRSIWRNLEWEGFSVEQPTDEADLYRIADAWFVYYNQDRIHQALNYEVPDERCLSSAMRFRSAQNLLIKSAIIWGQIQE